MICLLLQLRVQEYTPCHHETNTSARMILKQAVRMKLNVACVGDVTDPAEHMPG